MKLSEFLKTINEKLEDLKDINDDNNYDPEIIILRSSNKQEDIIEIDICERFNDPEEMIYISHKKLNLPE